MSCLLCASDDQAEFPAEIMVHYSGFKNVQKPNVLIFPTLLICLRCGFLQSTVPAPELALLAAGASTSERAEAAGA